MKRPRTAPSFREFLKDLGQYPQLLLKVTNLVPEPTVDGKYIHWDKLKYDTPPDGLTLEEWWFGLKMRRMPAREIPLRDASGQPFSFLLADPLPERLHHVDSGARGDIRMPEPIANPETQNQYRVRSLMEEAIASSRLEGASTSREVAKAMILEGRQPRDRSEQMIFNHFDTMRFIVDEGKQKLTRKLIFQIQRMVTEDTVDFQAGSGRFRRSDERIIVGDDSGEIFHEPPPADELESRMDLMCRFANGLIPDGFIHPLIRSIILHFWLVYDHPFIDGNGRTARALFYWSMMRQGYWLFEYISISKIILQAPAKYGRGFLDVETDENDLTYFLLYHSEVIRRAIDELHEYIARRALELRQAEADLRGLTMLNHRQRDLVAHAVHHPGQRYTIESHQKSHDVVYQTARTDLLDLVERRLFQKRKEGRFWYFFACDDLEARLRK